MKLRFSIFLLGLLSWSVFAGDAATLNFLGFSKEGKYLAFEQYGVTDGAGAPYVEIFFVDAPKNIYVAKPIKTDDSKVSSDMLLAAVRKNTLKAAESKLKELEIDPQAENYGERVVARSPHELNAEAKRARFSVPIALGGTATAIYELRLETTKTDTDCEGVGKAEMLTLKLVYPDGKTVQTLQKDKSLPSSRGCPFSYRIQDVYFYNKQYIAVFLSMLLPGFEGQNMRYLVITGKIEEQ